MALQISRCSAEETARRGDEIYDRVVRPLVEHVCAGKVAAIDIDTEAYAISEDALTASDQLLALHSDAEIWCVRVGAQALHRIGQRAKYPAIRLG